MAISSKPYRVGLILSVPVSIDDYDLPVVGNEKCHVCFYDQTSNNNYCDLIITDKKPDELLKIPMQQKDCHGTTLVINQNSNPLLEKQYNSIFTKTASPLKYKSIKNLTIDSIKKSINSELIKQMAKDNKIDSICLLFNKYTWRDLLIQLFKSSWLLLVPLIFIVLYLCYRLISSKFNFNQLFYLLCEFNYYNPYCKTDIFEELKLLSLLYAIFNLLFYYNYIFSIFDNINNEIFQTRPIRRNIHRGLQLFSPLLLFASILIISKELFFFIYSFRIAEENSFINIGSILDKYLSLLKVDYLLVYFLLLDVCLWVMTINFFKTISIILIPLSSSRQNNLIKEAQKSFCISMIWDSIILFIIGAFISHFVPDPQSKLAVQLILIQSVYLYINIQTIVYDFKYK